MKKAISALLVLVMLLAMAGCTKYPSKYDAKNCVHTNTSTEASLQFDELEGVMVFKLKLEKDRQRINYSAKLESGSATVSYDCDGTKATLYSIGDDGNLKSTLTSCPAGTVYIIVETKGQCLNGDFHFEVLE